MYKILVINTMIAEFEVHPLSKIHSPPILIT